ncbi:uroporphyrinogen-III C-methyltransferase [Prochlorococcus sp. MIT 1307]|uniref:uroporphyrinogen-III C-methyltransferase n=1 Tax=Prochlorococcus sp. MIT 1307 TaxID=3096219 RepID=UPI002A74D534|nr:uroporphyrinogen-III C-methyltransferase [Prochlorococcus sp. MIT 1307]
MTEDKYGTVYLVGGGPGDPDLLTVKAQRLLGQCDALVYDSLVPQELLELVSKSCQLYFVGKRRGHHSIPQSKINSVLREMARTYSCVVRLKGGDPFLFGRGAEEAAYLESHGVPVEVVPGVTAGIAVPAYAGIPVTHRRAGSSVTFVTGHEGIDKIRPFVNWRALALASDGLVIYMGLHNLQYIVDELIAGGLNPSTTSAVIQQGTVIGQRCLKAPLHDLVGEVKRLEFASPSIVMIGPYIDFQVATSAPQPANVTMPITF